MKTHKMKHEYESLDQLKQAWSAGEFTFPGEMLVAGLPYRYYKSYKKEFYHAIAGAQNPYIVYHTPAEYSEEAEAAGLQQWIVFLWGSPDGQRLVPYDLRTTTSSRGKAVYEQVETIGDVALLKISLPSGIAALKGKVDTGAEISSLHCDGKPNVVGQTVQFNNRHASPNAIQAPLVDQQAVSSADGGTEYRPVIELDVEVNGKVVRKAMFNLNDRSEMEYPVLIGQNVLEKTGFLVNPNQDGVKEGEEIGEWLTEEQLEQLSDDDIIFENVERVLDFDSADPQQLAAIYEMMDDADITLKDLVKHIRTQTLQRLEDMEY